MRNTYLPLCGGILLSLSSCFWFVFSSGESHARVAAKLREQKKYAEAITEYRAHISSRLTDSNREQDENPYFYLILIGDTYLESGDQERALESYIEAKDRAVETALVVDRVRRVARLYHEAGRSKEAVSILKRYRELDPFVFDLDIDENLKAIVMEEDKRSVSQ